MANILNNITSVFTNTIPSARSVFKPLLSILITFDDFFPYMFHERNYGTNIEGLFNVIYEAETQKWSSYDKYFMDPIFKSVNVDRDDLLNSYDTYYNYSSPTFIAR